jgi:hypothetical protein
MIRECCFQRLFSTVTPSIDNCVQSSVTHITLGLIFVKSVNFIPPSPGNIVEAYILLYKAKPFLKIDYFPIHAKQKNGSQKRIIGVI